VQELKGPVHPLVRQAKGRFSLRPIGVLRPRSAFAAEPGFTVIGPNAEAERRLMVAE
jgi:hypothetical protein